MLLDPRHLVEAPGLVAATLAVILLGKPLAALAIVLLLGHPLRVALAVAVALAQIGEFSFILAALGRGLGVLSDAAMHTLVAAAILSITLNPILYRLVEPLAAWAARRRWLPGRPTPAPAPDRASSHRAVVGYGPVGRTVTRMLRDNGIEPTVIELNLETVRRLREEGVPVVYGDASQRDTLAGAGVGRAGSLILSAAEMRGEEEAIRLARELNPAIRVLARAAYLRELPALRQAGADRVVTGEAEVALALAEALLRGLGATPEQIDRERDRAHTDLFGSTAPGELPEAGAGAAGDAEASGGVYPRRDDPGGSPG